MSAERDRLIEKAVGKIVDAALASRRVWVVPRLHPGMSYIVVGTAPVCTVRHRPYDRPQHNIEYSDAIERIKKDFIL